MRERGRGDRSDKKRREQERGEEDEIKESIKSKRGVIRKEQWHGREGTSEETKARTGMGVLERKARKREGAKGCEKGKARFGA